MKSQTNFNFPRLYQSPVRSKVYCKIYCQSRLIFLNVIWRALNDFLYFCKHYCQFKEKLLDSLLEIF